MPNASFGDPAPPGPFKDTNGVWHPRYNIMYEVPETVWATRLPFHITKFNTMCPLCRWRGSLITIHWNEGYGAVCGLIQFHQRMIHAKC